MLTRRSFAACAAAAPLLAASRAAAHGTPDWREGAEAPYAVQEIYPALYRGGIWIAGGFSPQAMGATERVIIYDPERDAWREGPALPTPSHHVHLVSLNDELWAIGGFDGGDTRMRWICLPRVLKLAGDRWVEAPSLPKPIGEAVPLAHEGRIHLIGGRSPAGAANVAWNDQADVDDHFVLAAGASAWERAAPLPLARNSAAGAVAGGMLHVISGRTVAGGPTGAHHIYDARAGAWREGAIYPDPRGGLAAATWHRRVVAGGGEIFEPQSVSDRLYAYSEIGGWSPIDATMPVTRHGHGMIMADETLYLVGGARHVGGRDTLARVDILA